MKIRTPCYQVIRSAIKSRLKEHFRRFWQSLLLKNLAKKILAVIEQFNQGVNQGVYFIGLSFM